MYSFMIEELESKVGKNYFWTKNCICCISERILVFDYGENYQK